MEYCTPLEKDNPAGAHDTTLCVCCSCGSVLLEEETGVPGENHRQTISHSVLWSTDKFF